MKIDTYDQEGRNTPKMQFVSFFKPGMVDKIDGLTATLILFDHPLSETFDSFLQLPEFREWCNKRLLVTFEESE